MTDWEREISELPWREPSESLRDKILGSRRAPVTARREPSDEASSLRAAMTPDQRMPFRWAAALAICTGLGGFFSGWITQNQLFPQVARVVTDVRVLETSSQQNSFDFSRQDTQILPGEFRAYLDTSTESQE